MINVSLCRLLTGTFVVMQNVRSSAFGLVIAITYLSASLPSLAQEVPSSNQGEPMALTIGTAYDARPVSSSWVMCDGSTGSACSADLEQRYAGFPLECLVLAIRDGLFFNRCDHAAEHRYDAGTVRIEGSSQIMGIVSGDALQGHFLYWYRNFDVGFSDREDGEYMRSISSGVVDGKIDPLGQITLVLTFDQQQTFDIEQDLVDDFLVKTGEWHPRDMSQQLTTTSVTSVYKTVGTAEDDTLLLPNLTSDDIEAEDFELAPVFYQHGVLPPQRAS